MAEPSTVGHVYSVLCVVSEQQNQRSSSLPNLCHLIFIPIKPLFHVSFLSLSCLNLLLFPLFVLLSVFSGFLFSPPPFLTLDLFSLWFLFLQQSISLFNLMLFSCLSRLCVWFSFSWRLAGKRAGSYPKILFLKEKKRKEKHDHACIQSRKSLKIWGKKWPIPHQLQGLFKALPQHFMQRWRMHLYAVGVPK